MSDENARHRQRRVNNPEGVRAYYRDRHERLKTDPTYAAQVTDRALRTKYGIGLVEYNALHAAQNGVCAICGLPERIIDDRTRQPRKLAVDHDKATGRVRGLLCFHCNSAIGKFNHSSILLLKAVRYLRV